MKPSKRILFSILAISLSFSVHSQGCSDAGFCTMGAMKPDQPFNKRIRLRLRAMELSFYRGKTSLGPIVESATADMSFSMNSRNSIQVKIPYQAVHGNLGHTAGVGDLSLCYTRDVFSSEKFDINLTLGGKIPTNNANTSTSDPEFGPGTKPYPMYYQTSLGTYDIIAGGSLISKHWLVATGIQHPFNSNDNKFLWTEWPDFPDQAYIQKLWACYELKRGTDVMLRIERNWRFSQFNFSAGLLPIFRVNPDEIVDDDTGERIKVPHSTGMAASAILTAGYSIDVRSSVKLLYGKRLAWREDEPDGLDRLHVVTISYVYRF